MSYNEALKDPRWQKKRLEILERDNWQCLVCLSKTKTLVVHHKKYCGDPWESPNDDLMTLCKDCHDIEHDFDFAINDPLKRIKENNPEFMTVHLGYLLDRIANMKSQDRLLHTVNATVLAWMLKDNDTWDLVRLRFLESEFYQAVKPIK